MAVVDVPNKPEFLYRADTGILEPGKSALKKGDIIPLPNQEGKTINQEKGKFVFAAQSYEHAASYGLKLNPSFVQVGNSYDSDIIVTLAAFGDEKYLQEILEKKASIQKVSSTDFQPVFHSEKPKSNEAPLEWISDKPVEVLEVETLTNREALRKGVQLFLIKKDLMEDIMSGARPSLTAIERRQLVIRNEAEWVNKRPEFDAYPQARSAYLTHLFEDSEPSRPSPRQRQPSPSSLMR